MLTYESVTQILDMVGRVHERLFSKVEGLSESQQTYRPDEESWSIAEIMEHLAIVHEGMGKVTSKIIREAEASGSTARSDGTIGPVSMEFLRELADQKFHAPDERSPCRRSENRGFCREAQEQLHETPQHETEDRSLQTLSGPTFPHNAFGPLNGYQWLALIGLHESKHLEQIKAIQASPGFPAAA